MTVSTLARSAFIALALVVSAALGGCASDTSTQSSASHGGDTTLHYHGGPKYPMSPG